MLAQLCRTRRPRGAIACSRSTPSVRYFTACARRKARPHRRTSGVALESLLLYHLSDTLKLSPRWIEHQKQMDKDALVYQQQRQQQRRRAISLEAAQFEMKMQAMRDQVGAFERRQAAQAKQVENFTNALNGITPTTDPLGNRHDVSSGPKANYWINGAGQVVNADTSPGPGWQLLKQRN